MQVAGLHNRFWIPAALVCVTGPWLGAQSSVGAAPLAARQFETRDHLVARASEAERSGQTSQAWLLRSRLANGDFQEGDRIVVLLEGSAVVSDTMHVRTGKVLQFPQMGDVSLLGVLRSELNDTLRQHLAKYLKTPTVRATPLLPIAVLGNVLTPGYHYVAADVVLRDVIMKAGGPTPSADLNHAVIRRAGRVIWNAEAVSVALTDGLSVDALHLRAGDELFVPERRRFQLSTLTTIVSSVVAVSLALLQLTR